MDAFGSLASTGRNGTDLYWSNETFFFMVLLRRSLQRAVDEHAGLPLRRLWLVRGSEPGDELLRALADLG